MLGFELAYIDPGSGTILLQFVIGAIIGAGFVFRRGLATVVRLLRRGG